jgi:tetratricopeptide (TPR) repeat protein
MSSDRFDQIEQEIKTNGETGDVITIGKIVVRVTQVIDEHVLHHIGIAGFILLGILIVLAAVGGPYWIVHSLKDEPSEMDGDFRVAVAGFASDEQLSDSNIGEELAQSVYLRLKKAFDELAIIFTVWGPNKVESIEGSNREARAQAAERIAQDVEADIVVYGIVRSNGSNWEVTPEFYISADNFYHAAEVVGEHDLGTAIKLLGQGNIADRIEVSSELTARVQALARIVIGLSYHSNSDFEAASNNFQMAQDIDGWEDDEGRHVLYLLIGNAANKEGDFDTAEAYYRKALDLDIEYARGYLGLANVYYRRAIEPFAESKDPTQTDLDLIARATKTYKLATQATNQPPLADIQTKARFGQGQCYFMRVYAGEEEFFDPAITKFESVIEDYADGENPRVIELAAESYARLALIYDLSDHPDLAVKNYEAAAELSEGNPERHKLYRKRAESIKESVNSTSQP